MGARNFYSTDYPSLTYLIDTYGLSEDKEYIADVRERLGLEEDEELSEEDLWGDINETANLWYEDAYYNAEDILKNHNTGCIDLSLEPGYYEGIQLIVSPDWDSTLDSESEREDIFKDIANVGEILNTLVDACGWEGDVSECIHQLMEDAEAIPVEDYDEPDRNWG